MQSRAVVDEVVIKDFLEATDDFAEVCERLHVFASSANRRPRTLSQFLTAQFQDDSSGAPVKRRKEYADALRRLEETWVPLATGLGLPALYVSDRWLGRIDYTKLHDPTPGSENVLERGAKLISEASEFLQALSGRALTLVLGVPLVIGAAITTHLAHQSRHLPRPWDVARTLHEEQTLVAASADRVTKLAEAVLDACYSRTSHDEANQRVVVFGRDDIRTLSEGLANRRAAADEGIRTAFHLKRLPSLWRDAGTFIAGLAVAGTAFRASLASLGPQAASLTPTIVLTGAVAAGVVTLGSRALAAREEAVPNDQRARVIAVNEVLTAYKDVLDHAPSLTVADLQTERDIFDRDLKAHLQEQVKYWEMRGTTYADMVGAPPNDAETDQRWHEIGMRLAQERFEAGVDDQRPMRNSQALRALVDAYRADNLPIHSPDSTALLFSMTEGPSPSGLILRLPHTGRDAA
jgi:hypothetical protein